MAVTTFCGDGTAVVTPGWVVDLGEGKVGFTTAADSAMAARLTRNSEVVVAPCSMRGAVASCAPQWHGTARVVTGPLAAQVHSAMVRRHRLQMTTLDLLGRLRRRASDEVAIVVDLPLANGHAHEVTNGRSGTASSVSGNDRVSNGWRPGRHGRNPAA